MRNSIGIISCEKLCLELPLEAPSVSLMKRSISHNCGNFLRNRTTIELPTLRCNLHPTPPPSYLWLVKCLILRVRNFKCIFLKCLLLYRLTSRQQFHFVKFLSRIPETWSNQSPIVSRWHEPTKSKHFNVCHVTRDDLSTRCGIK